MCINYAAKLTVLIIAKIKNQTNLVFKNNKKNKKQNTNVDLFTQEYLRWIGFT